jgi:hypothetical protein
MISQGLQMNLDDLDGRSLQKTKRPQWRPAQPTMQSKDLGGFSSLNLGYRSGFNRRYWDVLEYHQQGSPLGVAVEILT